MKILDPHWENLHAFQRAQRLVYVMTGAQDHLTSDHTFSLGVFFCSVYDRAPENHRFRDVLRNLFERHPRQLHVAQQSPPVSVVTLPVRA
jgi:hypothetical protein